MWPNGTVAARLSPGIGSAVSGRSTQGTAGALVVGGAPCLTVVGGAACSVWGPKSSKQGSQSDNSSAVGSAVMNCVARSEPTIDAAHSKGLKSPEDNIRVLASWNFLRFSS